MLILDSSEPFFTGTWTRPNRWLNSQFQLRFLQFTERVQYDHPIILQNTSPAMFLPVLRSWNSCKLLNYSLHHSFMSDPLRSATCYFAHYRHQIYIFYRMLASCLFDRYFSRVPNFQQYYFSCQNPQHNLQNF